MSKQTVITDDSVYWIMDWSKHNISDNPIKETIFEPEQALARLLSEGIVFLSDHWCEDEWPESARKRISINVECNDIFSWACCDSETIDYEDIQSVYDAWLENHEWGHAKWCSIKRNLKPQAPVIEAMKKAGVWDERMEALDDNQDNKAQDKS